MYRADPRIMSSVVVSAHAQYAMFAYTSGLEPE